MSYFDKFNNQNSGEDKDRGNLQDLINGNIYTITRVARCKSKFSNVAYVFELQELPNFYFFGNVPINAVFEQCEKDGMLGSISSVGVKFETRHSVKNNTDYIVPVFCDELPF